MTAVQEIEALPSVVAERMVTLRNESWELDVLPATGASLAGGRIRTADGLWRDLLRPTRRTVLGEPEKCSSFPMVPWSNRIRDGVLPFGDRTWQLQRNGADGTAIHGAARHSAWAVTDRTETRVVLELDTTGLVGVNFPWQFRAQITYALAGDKLVVATSVRNVDREPFPAGFGHHPYFQRTLSPVGTSAPPTPGQPVLEVPAQKGYSLVNALASGPAGAVPQRADFRVARPLTSTFVDDVLTAWEPGAPVRISYEDLGVSVDLHADPVYAHLVLYAPRKRPYFAVEPVTNVNNGFSLHAAGVPGTGVFVLEPGEERCGAFTMTLRT
ncbi:aldose epimerase [Cellulomonas sp. Root137]|uniref:aldose epimerase family protein n=1 Tax=Cellulomonas sp. Root137 TaxID=1736459 RepID=UPI0006F9F373|nr:aldose epimerase [Cellulomonas sp. Root137]KQY48108.1 aldose epimerase [Cellulomonas sp. Root137]KRD45617.1 aldose epimerase [Cellulomonas sp. Root930]